MIILFAPSEGKRPGGTLPAIDRKAFCCPSLFDKRLEVIDRYRNLLRKGDEKALGKLFGLKKQEEIKQYRQIDPLDVPTMKAILRYDGVAYDHLAYESLTEETQRFLDHRLLIFSNFFGPVMAHDRLPLYKLKQGEKIEDFAPERFYKEHFSHALDDLLAPHALILDLRAGFYEKFYKIDRPHVTMKFLKNGKSISHWAKAYRGMVARRIAQERIETTEALEAMQIEGLEIREIVEKKRQKEYIYEIVP